jgi:hypothetical protein
MEHLTALEYGITRFNASWHFTMEVAVLLMVVPRTELRQLSGVLKKNYPDLLFTIET